MADENETESHDDKTEETARWFSSDRYFAFVMLALVAVAAAAFGAGLAVAGGDDEERDTFAHELETWVDCLAEEGATVPGIEAHGDGGFTLEFEAGFFEEFEPERFVDSATACREILPLEWLFEVFGVPGEWLAGERERLDQGERFHPPDFLEELERRAESPLLDLLGDLPPGQLERLCRGVFESDRPSDDEGFLRQLRRICEREL